MLIRLTSHSLKRAVKPSSTWSTTLLSCVLPVALSLSRAARAAMLIRRLDTQRAAHPREEHFVPIYVAHGAAGSGPEGAAQGARMVCGLWGAKTVVFGV